MFINVNIENTPNATTKKFVLSDHTILDGDRVIEFTSIKDCAPSPLAMDLMNIPGVERVMLSSNFISLQVKHSEIERWSNIERLACLAITEQISSGKSIVDIAQLQTASCAQKPNTISSDADNAIVQQINAIIDDQVRPAVARDGGDVDFIKFANGIVYLKMKGACSGCPSAAQTLKHGIENMLRHYVPEVSEVQEWKDEQ